MKTPKKVLSFDSYQEFRSWLNEFWLVENPHAVQLDGRKESIRNPAVWVTFRLSEVPGLEATIELHGGTKREALESFSRFEIESFIIIPPNKGRKWRFHLKSMHGYINDDDANGMYAYLKCG